MMLASNRTSGQGLKGKKKLNLEALDESQMNASVSCEFGPDGIRFLRNNIKITKDGTSKITGDQILPLSMVSSEEVEFGAEIGRGASGFVQEGIYKPENIPIAIKTMNLYDKDKRHQVVNDLKNFLQDRLENLKGNFTELSNHLVQVYGAYYDEGSIKIIMELMDAGSLRGLLNMAKKLKPSGPYVDEPYLANIAYQILSGLYFIHSRKKQIHRDIKPENILINSLGQAKLTDFGISKQLEQTQGFSKTFVGTVTYMSPERLKGEPYAFSSDLWSLGLLLIELACGEYPYRKTKTFIEMLQDITTLPEPNLPDNGQYSEELRDFIGRCLSKDPLKRGTAQELMEHPWLVKNSELNYDLAEWVTQVVQAYKAECANEENAKAALEFNNNTPNQSQSKDNLYSYDQVSNLLNSYAMSGNMGNNNNMGMSNVGMFGQIENNNSGLYCSESISEMPNYQNSTGLNYGGTKKKIEMDLEVENLE